MSKRATKSGYETRRIDDTDPDFMILGESTIGTAEDVDKWILKKVWLTVGVKPIEYADGTWADRATLTYL